jgi:hypothetical protein
VLWIRIGLDGDPDPDRAFKSMEIPFRIKILSVGEKKIIDEKLQIFGHDCSRISCKKVKVNALETRTSHNYYPFWAPCQLYEIQIRQCGSGRISANGFTFQRIKFGSGQNLFGS